MFSERIFRISCVLQRGHLTWLPAPNFLHKRIKVLVAPLQHQILLFLIHIFSQASNFFKKNSQHESVLCLAIGNSPPPRCYILSRVCPKMPPFCNTGWRQSCKLGPQDPTSVGRGRGSLQQFSDPGPLVTMCGSDTIHTFSCANFSRSDTRGMGHTHFLRHFVPLITIPHERVPFLEGLMVLWFFFKI